MIRPGSTTHTFQANTPARTGAEREIRNRALAVEGEVQDLVTLFLGLDETSKDLNRGLSGSVCVDGVSLRGLQSDPSRYGRGTLSAEGGKVELQAVAWNTWSADVQSTYRFSQDDRGCLSQAPDGLVRRESGGIVHFTPAAKPTLPLSSPPDWGIRPPDPI